MGETTLKEAVEMCNVAKRAAQRFELGLPQDPADAARALEQFTAMRPDPARVWAEAEIARIAPELAEAPARVSRFLGNVQRMLVAGSGLDAARVAQEVAHEAATVAFLNTEHRRMMAELMSLYVPARTT